ncbi:Squalene--hopene cyclase [Planctomycetales bacterium 10988]|nr:Squalene--hopene cyclase [Planctomycetales bacterium 10988]
MSNGKNQDGSTSAAEERHASPSMTTTDQETPEVKKPEPSQADRPAARPVQDSPLPHIPIPVARPLSQSPGTQPPSKSGPRKVSVNRVANRRKIAAFKPIGVRRRLQEEAEQGNFRLWLRDQIRETPAFLASLLFHVLILILLAFLALNEFRKEKPFELSVRISDKQAEEELDQDQELLEEVDFEEFEEFEVEVLSPDPEQFVEDNPFNEPPANAQMEMLELQPIEVQPAASKLSVGAVGMFDGRGEASRGKLVQAFGGTTASESAVAKGLRWLAKVQWNDGRWRLEQFGGSRSDTAGTALGVLPFLGAGQTHKSGKYQETVGNALYWLRRAQLRDGDWRGKGVGNMYAHAQATLAMCEAYALTRDPELREPAQKGIDYIINAQHSGGGWRYSPGQRGDTSVLGWQLMALQSARTASLQVPEETLEKATNFLNQVQTDQIGSRYGYQPNMGPRQSMTAEAILCRQYTGWKREEPGMEKAVEWLLSAHPPQPREPNMYYWYYATQAMHHFGGTPWEQWNSRMREMLVASQVPNGENEGSWNPVGGHSNVGGRVYMTSLAILTLEVYYRHLPIYDNVVLE